jgi:hypothetical protein
MHFRFVRKAMLALRPKVGRCAYRPEKYYLRGPGPMTLDTTGEMLRAETAGSTQEPLPQRWLDMLNSLEAQMHPRMGTRARRRKAAGAR